jgi:hypothetical protein
LFISETLLNRWRALSESSDARQGARLWLLAALATLLGVSFTLRVVALDWGIPEYDPGLLQRSLYRQSYHMDEDNILWALMQMRPAEGNFDIKDYHWGSLQHYLVYGALLVGSAVGVVPAPWEEAFRQGDAEALRRFYILGRLVSVMAGVSATFIAAALASMLAGHMAGIAAGVAYALSPLAVVEAHYLTNDVTMSAFVAASVLASVSALRSPQPGGEELQPNRETRLRLWWLVLAGLLLGLAIAAKYSALFAAPSLAVAQWATWRAEGFVKGWRVRLALLVLPWLAVVGGFLLGEPYALLSPGSLLAGLRYTSDGNSINLNNGLGPVIEMLAWQGRYLAELGLTWPLACIALAGLGVMLWRIVNKRQSRSSRQIEAGSRSSSIPSYIVLLAAIVGLVLGLALNRVSMMRYTQPMIPLLCVAAGVGWAAIPFRILRGVAGAIAIAVAGVITLGQLSLMAGPHPANDLSTWMRAHLKDGQVVARLWPEYPLLDEERYRLIRLDPWWPSLAPGERPDYIILDDMQLGPGDPQLKEMVARDYEQVATFQAQPRIGGFTWSEGTTPHDWKYSHPTLVVYVRR